MSQTKLILASGSRVRATLLKNADIPFEIVKTDTDEALIKEQGLKADHDLQTIALNLALAKAKVVDAPSDTVVLGADQLMEFEGRAFDKPKSISEAKERLLSFRGKPHSLINASVLMQNRKMIWHHIERPVLHVRNFTPSELETYFEQCNDDILNSVGAYQLEHVGIRLFEKIEGDYFAILGLAISPLLAALRELEVIEF